MPRTLILLLTLVLAVGCANIETRRHANELQSMRQDDEYCIGHGLRYPNPAYINYRYKLQNSRALRLWKSLQLAQAAVRPKPIVGSSPPDVTQIFHALDRARFQCWPEPQFGYDYIFCGERDKD
ncbi:MAG: hypothetical protein ACRESA_07195 [Gammaproteobacteria bacterium]